MRGPSPADRLLFGLAGVFLAAVGLAALGRVISPWIIAGYAAASIATLGVYGWDKYRARKQEWRISEATLHVMELLGGWPGALIAQRIFRHKTRKLPFQILFWLIVVTHFTAWGWFIALRG